MKWVSDTKENILLKTNKIFGVAVAAERSRVYREKRWQMKNTTPDCHIFSFAMCYVPHIHILHSGADEIDDRMSFIFFNVSPPADS